MEDMVRKLPVVPLLASFCLFGAASIFAETNDDGTIKRMRLQGIKHTTERAILWVEKGYLSNREIRDFGSVVDRGIVRAEAYLRRPFDREHHGENRIHYFIRGGRFASHVYGGYHQRRYRRPVVFLSFVKEGKAPYLHETVHILAWDFHALWIREGLAVYLNDKLGGYRAFPNFGRDIDECAKEYITDTWGGTLALIGKDGIPTFSTPEERRTFYVFSGSFVKFLDGEFGTEKLMSIYRTKKVSKTFRDLTGKDMKNWKQAWLKGLTGQR